MLVPLLLADGHFDEPTRLQLLGDGIGRVVDRLALVSRRGAELGEERLNLGRDDDGGATGGRNGRLKRGEGADIGVAKRAPMAAVDCRLAVPWDGCRGKLTNGEDELGVLPERVELLHEVRHICDAFAYELRLVVKA